MTHLQSLDFVLLLFCEQKVMTFNQVHDKAKGIKGVRTILEQLAEDKYLIIHKQEIEENEFNRPNPIIQFYEITGTGKMFIEQGGYSSLQKLKDEQRILEKKNSTLTLILVVGTGISALYYILEILDRIFHIYPS